MAEVGNISLRLLVQTEHEVAVGEIVELKSSGPPMTVLGGCDSCGEVDVGWFNFDEELGCVFYTETFPAACLKPFEGDV